jgi:hypothetical protein
MVGGMQIGLRMGHKTEKAPRLIADAGYGVRRTVGVPGISHFGLPEGFVTVLKNHLVLVVQPRQNRFVPGYQFPLPVADGKINPSQAQRKHAGRSGIRFQVDPPVFKFSGIVVGQGDGLSSVAAIKTGKQPQFHHQLKPVADAQDQFPFINETQQRIVKALFRSPDSDVQQTVCVGLGGAEIVAIDKSSGQVEKMIVVEALFPAEQFADVDDVHLVRTGKTAGMGHFPFAVRPVSRDHHGSYPLQHRL